MALASGPRFALVIGAYWIMKSGLQQRKKSNVLNTVALVLGIVRTVRLAACALRGPAGRPTLTAVRSPRAPRRIHVVDGPVFWFAASQPGPVYGGRLGVRDVVR